MSVVLVLWLDAMITEHMHTTAAGKHISWEIMQKLCLFHSSHIEYSSQYPQGPRCSEAFIGVEAFIVNQQEVLRWYQH